MYILSEFFRITPPIKRFALPFPVVSSYPNQKPRKAAENQNVFLFDVAKPTADENCRTG